MAPPDESTAASAGAPQPGGRRRARALFVLSIPAAALLPLLWLPVVNAYQPAWALVGLFGYGALAWLAVVEASRIVTSAEASVVESGVESGPAEHPPAAGVAAHARPDAKGPAKTPAKPPAKSPAHDFNNAMMTIRVSADLLRMEASLGEDARAVIEDLDGAATTAAELIRAVVGEQGAGQPPAAKDGPPVQPPGPVAPAPRPEGSTVLLAEDEAAVLKTMKIAFESAGFVVLPAPDAAQAIEIATAHDGPIDLLCTDASMPGMPTAKLVHAFRELHPGRPVLICSGNLEEELARDGLKHGQYTYLAKPFSVNDLLLTARRTIAEAAVVAPSA